MRSHGRRRARLDADVALLNALPDESTARAALLRHVDAEVERTIHDYTRRTRNPAGVALALVFLLAATACGLLALFAGAWWLWFPVVFLGPFGVIGLIQDAFRRERDENGSAIET
ncbi:hypothetical protein GCM10009675_30340 [Prauserella alba]|uniref:2TM domain-containing protein n=1 Tax=Prauserella alba TaxID=176898 RepID=A0ABN1VEX4_9PSEU